MKPFASPIRSVVVASALVLAACGSDTNDRTATSGDETGDDADADAAAPLNDQGDDAADTHDDDADHLDDHADDAVQDDGVLIIEIVMDEFLYEPETVEIPAGEPVRLMFVNRGAIEHEAMIGDAHQQDEFAEMGGHGGHDGDDGHHGDLMAITLGAGESGHLDVMFDKPTELLIGCHLPGHWEAGMQGSLQVA